MGNQSRRLERTGTTKMGVLPFEGGGTLPGALGVLSTKGAKGLKRGGENTPKKKIEKRRRELLLNSLIGGNQDRPRNWREPALKSKTATVSSDEREKGRMPSEWGGKKAINCIPHNNRPESRGGKDDA